MPIVEGSINGTEEKKIANDKVNYVISCKKVNSFNCSATPYTFLKRINDNKGTEYKIINFCKYFFISCKVKLKYNLSFRNNNSKLFSSCLLNIKEIDF